MSVLFPLWADNPAMEDLLGFDAVSQPVVEAARRDGLLPVTIGIYGPWGSGKSTVLSAVATSLGLNRAVVVVRVNPWEYDTGIDIKAELIGEILSALRQARSDEQALPEKAMGILAKLVKRVRWSKAITLAGKAQTGLPVGVEQVTDLFAANPGDDLDARDLSLAGFRGEFETLLESIEDLDRVVVLVDDLDRCLPEAVVAVFEGIKVFLAVPKMAFVIAADEDAIVEAVKVRFSSVSDPATMARQYLEKIVQLPLRVPALGEPDTHAYLALLQLQQLRADATLQRELVAYCDERRRAGHADLLEDVSDELLPMDARTHLVLAKTLAPVLHSRTEGNPRRLKRFLNAYWMRCAQAELRHLTLNRAALAKLMVLEHFAPDDFRMLIAAAAAGRLPGLLALLNEQISSTISADDDLAQTAETAEHVDKDERALAESLHWWSVLPPQLMPLELDPYLRLAATLHRIPVGAARLRDDLRQVFTALMSKSLNDRNQARKVVEAMSVKDRLSLLGALAAELRARPDDEKILTEALVVVATGDDSLIQALAIALQNIDHRELGQVVPVVLEPLASAPPIAQLLRAWTEHPSVPAETRKAARDALALQTRNQAQRGGW
ncbi:P-loop NTPase fold protein [Streptosporangium sp. NPDC049248]|uniref:KAP family P-loop NTPase fold protein n=1 Tax=Streptosporangium sp. NPDC049248 TaxID=3155651 RepID=UPI003423AF1A